MNEENPWGLGEPPMTVTLFVGEGEESDEGIKTPWYMFDHDSGNKLPVSGSALYGRLLEIRVKKKVFKQKEGFKTLFIFGTPLRKFSVQSGSDTTFTRKLLFLLQQVQDLKQKLCLSVRFGNDPKIIFPTLWNLSSGSTYKAEWDDKAQLFPIVNLLRKKLGHQEQTLAGIRKEFEEGQRR